MVVHDVIFNVTAWIYGVEAINFLQENLQVP